MYIYILGGASKTSSCPHLLGWGTKKCFKSQNTTLSWTKSCPKIKYVYICAHLK